jgi:hypothetical protein
MALRLIYTGFTAGLFLLGVAAGVQLLARPPAAAGGDRLEEEYQRSVWRMLAELRSITTEGT